MSSRVVQFKVELIDSSQAVVGSTIVIATYLRPGEASAAKEGGDDVQVQNKRMYTSTQGLKTSLMCRRICVNAHTLDVCRRLCVHLMCTC